MPTRSHSIHPNYPEHSDTVARSQSTRHSSRPTNRGSDTRSKDFTKTNFQPTDLTVSPDYTQTDYMQTLQPSNYTQTPSDYMQTVQPSGYKQTNFQTTDLTAQPSCTRTGTTPSRGGELVRRGTQPKTGAAYGKTEFSGALQRLQILEDRDRSRDQQKLIDLEMQVREERARADRAERNQQNVVKVVKEKIVIFDPDFVPPGRRSQ